MPLELHIIRAHEFVRVNAQGHFDLAASKAALAQLAGACRKRGINQALVDLRALHPGPKPVFSPADLVELVKTFHQVGFTHQLRLAILYKADPFKRARLFAFLSTLHGWNVQAFSDFEKAIYWLSQEPVAPVDAVYSAQGKPIPVREIKRASTPPARPRANKPFKSRHAGAKVLHR